MQPSGDRAHPSRAALRAAARALIGGVGAGVLAIAALTACSGTDSSDASTANGMSASGASTASAAPPGKYQVLPEPCGAVSASTLKSLVPEAEDYAGVAELTYDTDRRVGCEWSGRTDEGNHYLRVDFLRVVSYDTTVSDETQARADYDDKAVSAGIATAVAASTSASASTSTATSTPPSATASPSTSATDALAPRTLSDLADGAYLNDVLKTRDSGVHRDITVVFRKANVLVTVEYSQWSTDNSVIPTSQELQDGARKVAAELADQLDE